MASNYKEWFVAELGQDEWNSSWERFMELDPEFFKASVRLMSVPKKKSHLSPRIQALITLVVDSAATHLYLPGIATSIKSASAAGATVPEILEAIELACTLGIHACNVGIPTLVEVMKEEGIYESHPTAAKPFDEQRQHLQKEFTQKRGYWHTFWEDFLALDPEFFGAYTEFSSVPWIKDVNGTGDGKGALEPMVKELMYCAFDAAATHLYRPGLKEHMRNALRYGATVEQILEVLELATLLSIHTANMTMPILARHLADSSRE